MAAEAHVAGGGSSRTTGREARAHGREGGSSRQRRLQSTVEARVTRDGCLREETGREEREMRLSNPPPICI